MTPGEVILFYYLNNISCVIGAFSFLFGIWCSDNVQKYL